MYLYEKTNLFAERALCTRGRIVFPILWSMVIENHWMSSHRQDNPENFKSLILIQKDR